LKLTCRDGIANARDGPPVGEALRRGPVHRVARRGPAGAVRSLDPGWKLFSRASDALAPLRHAAGFERAALRSPRGDRWPVRSPRGAPAEPRNAGSMTCGGARSGPPHRSIAGP